MYHGYVNIRGCWVKGIWELYYLCSFSTNLKLFQSIKFIAKYVGKVFPIMFIIGKGEYKYK